MEITSPRIYPNIWGIVQSVAPSPNVLVVSAVSAEIIGGGIIIFCPLLDICEAWNWLDVQQMRQRKSIIYPFLWATLYFFLRQYIQGNASSTKCLQHTGSYLGLNIFNFLTKPGFNCITFCVIQRVIQETNRSESLSWQCMLQCSSLVSVKNELPGFSSIICTCWRNRWLFNQLLVSFCHLITDRILL